MFQKFVFCIFDEEGSSAPEYAIIASIIVVAIAVTVGIVGNKVLALLQNFKFW